MRKEGGERKRLNTSLVYRAPSPGVLCCNGRLKSLSVLLGRLLQESGSFVLFTHLCVGSTQHGACHKTGTQPTLADCLNEL